MADDLDPSSHSNSQTSDQPDVSPAKEDAETAATRKELKHTAISETQHSNADADDSSSNEKTPPRSKTPDDAQIEALRDQIGSPKKKRAHDEVEADQKDDVAVISLDAAASPPSGGRTARSEPEKKRARDDPTDPKSDTKEDSLEKDAAKPTSTENLTAEKPPVLATKITTESSSKPASSEDAFKKSAFSALASGPSPFLAGPTGKSVFGASPSSTSPFAAPSNGGSVFGGALPSSKPAPQPLPTLGNSSTQSPFGMASNGSAGSVFGSGLTGFGGAGGGKLTSFATPGQSSLKPDNKPAKNFGAPESDNSEGSGDDGSDKEDEREETASAAEKEGSLPPTDDKRKPKLQRVQVDDGEAGEATLISVRAKIYAMDRDTKAWKERGRGYLKINAPVASVETDDKGNPIPGSFDASALEAEEGDDEEKKSSAKGPRLIMRQDHTHRVILNTAIIPMIKFAQNDSLKAAQLIFQAPEESGLSTLTLKMNPANAKDFLKEWDSIIRELTA